MSAAPDDLFKVDKDATKLGEDNKKIFHTIVAKMLNATMQASPDTLVAIALSQRWMIGESSNI
jgi:hypothetical protein